MFFDSKFYKTYSDNIPDKIDELVKFFKTEMNEINTKEKEIEEMKTTTSAFSKTGVDFEFNVWYLLPIKIVKFHYINNYR